MRRQVGFTLLEVMIALLITALALAALVGAAGRAASDTGHLRDRTEAAWVAQNVIADLRLAPEWPAPGTQRGQTMMLGRRWFWQVRISAAVKPLGTSFSKFIGTAAKKNIALDLKILSTLAQENPETFTRIVKEVMA